MTLRWSLPGREIPGYQERRLELLDLLDAEATADSLDRLAHHLVQYVVGPITHDDALAQIMDMDLEEYRRLIAGLLFSADGQVVPHG